MPLQRSTAKDVFFHLLAIVTLYIGVISFIALFFQYTNVKFPDQLDFFYAGALEIIRQSMASIIVVWPVFIFVSWLIYRDFRREPDHAGVAIRKWLLYLTLFVTSMTMIIDLITLINYFLNGEITVRFVLKVMVVLLSAGAVFGYYLWDLRREMNKKNKLPTVAAIVTSVVIVASIILGFVFVGSPATQRLARLDGQRINDLNNIQNEIINYYSLKQVLPTSLDQLNNSITGFAVPVDPESKTAYEYQVVETYKFNLCAVFNTDSSTTPGSTNAPSWFNDPYGQNWSHAIGRVCFERTIDPALYPKPATVIK